MKQEIYYSAHGAVLGKYNEIGELGDDIHPIVTITAATKQEVIDKSNKMLKDGSLDFFSTFGQLIGAILIITKHDRIWIEDKDYLRFEYDRLIIGNLTEEQIKFIEENM